MSSFLKKHLPGIAVIAFLALSFFLPTPSYAATLTPGALFTSCGDISAAGVYYLNANISTTSAACIHITSAGATIYSTTTFSISQAIIATSTGTATGYSFTLGGNVQINGSINALGSGGQGPGTVTFASTTSNHGTVIANAIFNNSAFTYATSTLTASSTIFNNTSYNLGTVNASSTTFNNTSWNNGTTTATTTFTGNVYSYNSAATSTSPQLGVVTSGIILFTPATGSSTVTFNVGTASTSNACTSAQCVWSTNTSLWNFGTSSALFNFYGNARTGTTTTLSIASSGQAYFYDTSYNVGSTTAATTTFSGTSYNIGTITASSTTFNNTSYNDGIVTNNATFNNSAYNSVGYNWVQQTGPGSLNWAGITSSSDGTHLAADVNGGYIYTSTNSGASWTQQTTSDSRGWYSVASSADGTKLLAAVNSGYLYTSTTSGTTWATSTSAGSLGWRPTASSADGTHLAAAVYNGYIYISTTSGATWTQETGPGSQSWDGITSSSDGTHLAADVNSGYIYTSTNSGVTWTQQTGSGSRSWQAVASSADGTHLVAGAYGGYIYTSANSGVTWTQQTGSGSRSWQAVASSADGTHLVAAVNGGYIYTSTNSGVSWTQQTGAGSQNWNAVTSSSDGTHFAAVVGTGYIYTGTQGIVTGNATFNNSTYNSGLVSGTATFEGANSYSWNSTIGSVSPQAGIVSGSVIFTPTSGSTITFNVGTASTTSACSSAQCQWNINTSAWSFGTSTLTWNFYGDAANEGTISNTGDIVNFYDSSINGSTLSVSTTTFSGTGDNVSGATITASSTTFSNSTYNAGTVTASSTVFNNSTYNQGTVTGNATFNNSAYNVSYVWTQQNETGNWTSITSSSDGTKLGLLGNFDYIQTSINSGITWTQQTSLSSSQQWNSITSSADGTHLAAAVNGGYIYTSTDSGNTWTQASVPYKYWYSITSSSDGTKLAAVAYNDYIYTSTTSGASWTQASVPSESWQSITSSSDGTHLAAVTNGQGIYTSTDSGNTWTQTSAPQENWQSITSSSDGSHLAAVAYYSNYIYTSLNFGVTWTQTSAPAENWKSITSSSDGTHLVALYGDYIYSSSDSGVTWTQTSAPFGSEYWDSVTSSSDGTHLAAAISGGHVYTAIPGIITGNATFTGSSYNQGFVFGNATFSSNTFSWNSTLLSYTPQVGTVTGSTIFTPTSGSTVTFNVGTASTSSACSSAQCQWNINTSSWNFGTSTPTWNFYGNAANEGTINTTGASVYFYDSSINGSTLSVATTTFSGTGDNVAGATITASSTTFDNSTYNAGTVTASSTVFNNSAYNGGFSWVQHTGNSFDQETSLASSADGTHLASAAYGYIYTSTNSGSTWIQQNGATYENWTAITSSADGTHLAAAVNGGYIYTSTDSGNTWTQQNGSTYEFWQGITSSADGTHLAAVTYGGSLYTSTTSGATWTQTSAPTEDWSSITSSADGTHLAAAVFNGYIYTSTDSGVTWTPQTGAGSQDWWSITSSSNGTHIAAAVNGGYIYTSTDSGNTWTQQNGSTYEFWQGITSSADGTHLAAVDYGGYIYSSTDSGISWSALATPGSALWQSIASSANGSLVAGGQNIYLWTGVPGVISGNATFSGNTFSWNGTLSSFTPQAGIVSGITYFFPTSGSAITFNVGMASTTEVCSSAQCVWSSDTSNWNFGTSTVTFNFYGDAENGGDVNIGSGLSNFYDTSANDGTTTVSLASFTGHSSNVDGVVVGNANVYPPVSDPLGGTVTGTTTYIGYVFGNYFNDANTRDGDWGNLANWWEDASTTIQANSFPLASSTVYIEDSLSQNTSGTAIAGNIIFSPDTFNDIDLTAATTTFSGTGNNQGDITGDAIFNDQSTNSNYVSGNAVFTGSEYSIAEADVDPTGGDDVGGQITFAPIGTSTVTFNVGTPGDDSNTYQWETYTNAWDFGTSTALWNFYGESENEVYLIGSANFNDKSANQSGITGNATFNDASYDDNGYIYGNMTLNTSWYDNDNATLPTGGVLNINGNSLWTTGNVGETIYDSQGNPITDFVFGDSSYNDGLVPSDINTTFNDSSYNGNTLDGNATFDGSSYNNDSIYGTAVFNDDSYNYETIYNGATFNDNSYNNGYIDGDTTFNDNSYNQEGSIAGNATFTGSLYSIDNNDFDPTGESTGGGIEFQTIFAPLGTSTVTFDVGDPGNYGESGTWNSYATNWTFGTSTSVTPVWNFYGDNYNNGGVLSSNFYDSSYNNSYVYGTATFNDDSYDGVFAGVAGNATFNGDSYADYNSAVEFSATFNDNSYNQQGASVGGIATFNGNSYDDEGNLQSDAYFNGDSYDIGGSISRDMYLNTTWYDQDGGTVPTGGVLNINGSSYWGTSYIGGTIYDSQSNPITAFVFGDSSYNANTIPSGISALFTSSSYNEGTVSSDATFNDDSYNGGTVDEDAIFTGNSGNNAGAVYGNASVYSPVVRPLGGVVLGNITYYGYGALYFNDQASGAGGDGDWNDSANWWTDASDTIAANIIGQSGYDVVAQTSITQNSAGGPVDASSVTFTGSAINDIEIDAVATSTFEDSSINEGTIDNNALFLGDGSTNSGTVQGPVIREYTSNATTTRDFTSEGGTNNWTIIASNATVDLTAATYNSTDIFEALANGSFITNPGINAGASVTPSITISTPASATTTYKWLPSVNWDTSVSCEYALDGGSYTTVNCANNGSDIARPSAGTHTLALQGTDSNGDITQMSESFTYNNTAPIYTSCGADLLDESRTYYLTGNVTNTCTILANNVTLKGAQSTTTIGYAVNGDIVANGTTTGANGFSITLDNLRVNGTVSADGADGSTNVNGGNGGNITIATSTTGNISSIGGDPQQNGGNGGTITILNSLATSSALVIANGGNSGGCGYGGSGGNVSLLYSSGYTVSNTAGTGNSGGCSPSGSQGQSGGQQVVGSYGTQGQVSGGSSNNTNPTSVPGQGVVTSAGSAVPLPINAFPGALPTVTLPVNILSPLNLTPLPTYGTTTGSFNFNSPVTHFLFAPFPPSLTKALKPYPQLTAYLASLNISSAQTLASLKHTAVRIATTTVPGLFSLTASSTPVKLSFSYDPTSYLIETGTVQSGALLTVHLPTTSPVTLSFEGVTETMYQGYLTFNAPTIGGTYVLSSKGVPVSLALTVLAPPVNTPPPSTLPGWVQWIANLFNW